MTVVILLSRLLLAAVLAVAGIAKLFDLEGSRQSLPQFGVPKALAGLVALLLPILELACAAALLLSPWALQGAEGSAVLLTIFTVGMAVPLARGKAPDCHCFGQLSTKPVSWSSLVRNTALLALALLIAWKGREDLGQWPADFRLLTLGSLETAMVSAILALTAAVAGLTWLLVHVLRQNGRLMVRLEALEKKAGVDPNAIEVEGLPIGADAPALRLASLDGRTITSETLEERGLPIILVFTELGCGACDALLPEVAQWQKEYQSRLEIVPISGGALDANLAKSAKHGLKNLLLQAGRETAEAYKVNGTPSAVVIAEGKIGAPLAAGADAIRELVARNTLPPPAKKGDRVPELKLKNLEGATIDLASLRGRRSLVLFWSPSCGFCQQMLDEVKRWERNPPRNAPDLVIVSSGTAEVNRQQGFRSTVLLDPIFGAGNVLGAGGTPSAVVIDEEGRVASEVGVGAASVMELAGSEN